MDYKFIKTDYLETVSGGDRELIKELTDMFREQVVEMHSEMVSLLSEKSRVRALSTASFSRWAALGPPLLAR